MKYIKFTIFICPKTMQNRTDLFLIELIKTIKLIVCGIQYYPHHIKKQQMIQKKIAGSILLIFILTAVAVSQPRLDMSNLFTINQLSRKAIFLTQPSDIGIKSISGTSFILKIKERYILITAKHVAKNITPSAKLVFPLNNSGSYVINLGVLAGLNDWKHHNSADLSAIEIKTTKESLKLTLDTAAFPLEHFTLDEFPVGSDVIMIGYPILDVIGKKFSPLFFETKISSIAITQPCIDNTDKNLCETFFLQSPSFQGLSGGPVISGVRRSGIILTDRTYVLGIVSATAVDNTGGKAAKIVPIKYLNDLLEKFPSL